MRWFLLLIAGCAADPDSSTTGVETGTGTPAGTPVGTVVGTPGGTVTTAEAGPTRYPAGVRHSPITPSVVDAMAAIAARAPRSEDLFLKVGDSMTVDGNALACFAGTDVHLADHGALQPTLDWFAAGDAAGDTPFDRDSAAARIGMSVGWSLSGAPAPVDQEIAAVDARYALIQYGTNDLQLGTTPLTAIWAFGSGMLALSDHVADRGIVPLFTTIPPRGDDAGIDAWVPVYNDVIRAVAQAQQTPVMDLHGALAAIPGNGLAGDGVHLSALDGWRGCQLTTDGLTHGNNVRNLLWLEALDRALLARDGTAPDSAPALRGSGTLDDPFVVDGLPFSHRADTATAADSRLDGYPGCDSGQDESGHEQYFALELAAPTRLRAFVFDANGVDVDLHLLGDPTDGATCVQRDHRHLDVALDAGRWTLVVDSFVDGSGRALEGDYLLVLRAD